MILEDFVMLGTTVPEPNITDGRVFVCSAGVSEECRRLIRIYPLARKDVPNRWGMFRVRLQRNPRDSRQESFQVAGDRTPGVHPGINSRFEQVQANYPTTERSRLLSRFVVGSIKEANAKRLSLAILQPDGIELNFEANPQQAENPQLVLFDTGTDEDARGARRFPWMPRIRFRDADGRHNLMLRDWGAFELQRKKTETYFLDNLAGALHLTRDSSLLVGNMNNQRNTWLVISVLNGLRGEPTLFDSLPTTDESVNGLLREQILTRDGGRCTRCGSVSRLTIVKEMSLAVPHSGDRLDDFETVCGACASFRPAPQQRRGDTG